MNNPTRKSIFWSFLWSLIFGCISQTNASPVEEETQSTDVADTVIVVDNVQVTAIKQGRVLRSRPVASTIVGSRGIERMKVVALKNLSHTVPNLLIPDYGSRMTSSIYVRGLGARIDQPVMGLNVDNVPMMNKNTFDFELADVERIEVLRGPQSTLYGRNTMGGVINVYTYSPLLYQGTRIKSEYSSGNTFRLQASTYQKLSPKLGMSLSGYYTQQDGFFENSHTGQKCDWEKMGGIRWKSQYRGDNGWMFDNTFSLSRLRQGGYPYAYIGEDKLNEQGNPIIRHGEIAYNDPCGYERTTLSDGLTFRYEADRYTISSITSYQYQKDCMTLDNDFLPLSFFTMRQAITEHTVTEDIVIRSRNDKQYGWLFGLFGFYRHQRMDAPVTFKEQGINDLIMKNATAAGVGIYEWDKSVAPEYRLPLETNFRNPSFGIALYHESSFKVGKWSFTAGLRMEVEQTKLHYRSRATLPYTLTIGSDTFHKAAKINDQNTIRHTYTEFLPKFTAMYSFDSQRNLYLSIARGYKAGGFNTQMFSDILQTKLMWKMASGLEYDEPDIMSYRPEYSWNFEFGGHFKCMDGAVRGDFSLYYIHVDDQQLTIFPDGQNTGRMMANAGKSRSWGAEFSIQFSPFRQLDVNTAYGFCDARFKEFNDGKHDYQGQHVPYAPQHTFNLRADYTIETDYKWLGDIVLHAGVKGVGKIWWNEQNTLREPFYALMDASIRIEQKHFSLDIWGRNLTNKQYNVFYFKSMGNEFVQRGRPRTFGVTLSVQF